MRDDSLMMKVSWRRPACEIMTRPPRQARRRGARVERVRLELAFTLAGVEVGVGLDSRAHQVPHEANGGGRPVGNRESERLRAELARLTRVGHGSRVLTERGRPEAPAKSVPAGS